MTPGAIVVANLSENLGVALCQEICARGHSVVGLSRNEEALEAAAARAGSLFTGLPCDLDDTAAISRAFEAVRARFGGAGILVNGPLPRLRRDILDETAESFMARIDADLGAVVGCTREALSDMVDRGRGRIVNVFASTAFEPEPASAACAVTHEAARTLSRALVADLGDRFPNIVVNDWVPRILGTRAERPEGEALAQAARWGATLVLTQEPFLNGTVWLDDRAILPRRPIRRRVADWLYGRHRVELSIAGLEVLSHL